MSNYVYACLIVLSLGGLMHCVSSDPPPPGQVDMALPDMPPLSPPDMTTSRDMRRDMVMVVMPDMAPPMLCVPTIRECTGEATARVCDGDGQAWIEVGCEEGDICEGGECVMGPICEDGESTCLDSMNRQFCRPGGMMFGVEACGGNTSCIDGECVSGELNGTLCSAHDDCAGSKCHCGEMTGEGCADTFTSPAYCTSPCQSQSDCADSEWCFSSQTHLITSQAANYDHCVPRCEGACAQSELGCKRVPIKDESGEVIWAQGCYFKDVKEVGEECASDVECLGGYCLKDYFSTGYCSIRCEDSACPDNAACIELKPAEFWCALKCGDGISSSAPCPLDVPDDRLDVTCAYRQQRQGGSARVCVSTSQ